MSGHGGKRLGAGRPRKWSNEQIIAVGQACEKLARQSAVSGDFSEAASQRTKLPRGMRKHILEHVALENRLTVPAVNYIWNIYRLAR